MSKYTFEIKTYIKVKKIENIIINNPNAIPIVIELLNKYMARIKLNKKI